MGNSTHLSRAHAMWKAPLYRSIRFLLTVLLSEFQNQSKCCPPETHWGLRAGAPGLHAAWGGEGEGQPAVGVAENRQW